MEEGISIVMPVLGNAKYTKEFFSSFVKTHATHLFVFEFVVINNGKDKETKEVLNKYKGYFGGDKFSIIENEQNAGVCRSWNQGVEKSKYPFICIVNNDIEFRTMNGILPLRDTLKKHRNVYWTSPKTCYEKDSKKRIIQRPHHYEQLRYGITVDHYVVGCCFMCPKICFEEIGLFDEEFDIKYYEDLDFINRILEHGKKIKMTEESLIYHAVGATSKHTAGGGMNEINYHKK